MGAKTIIVHEVTIDPEDDLLYTLTDCDGNKYYIKHCKKTFSCEVK